MKTSSPPRRVQRGGPAAARQHHGRRDSGHLPEVGQPGRRRPALPGREDPDSDELQLDDVLSRYYKAIELTFDKRFSSNWQASMNYTLSRAEGNHFGDFFDPALQLCGRELPRYRDTGRRNGPVPAGDGRQPVRLRPLRPHARRQGVHRLHAALLLRGPHCGAVGGRSRGSPFSARAPLPRFTASSTPTSTTNAAPRGRRTGTSSTSRSRPSSNRGDRSSSVPKVRSST